MVMKSSKSIERRWEIEVGRSGFGVRRSKSKIGDRRWEIEVWRSLLFLDGVALAGGEDLAALQDDAGEGDLGAREWFVDANYDVEDRGGVGGETGCGSGAADDPFGFLAHDFAGVVEEEDGGAGGLDGVGPVILHG